MSQKPLRGLLRHGVSWQADGGNTLVVSHSAQESDTGSRMRKATARAPNPARKNPVPSLSETQEQTAPTAMHNAVRKITGRPEVQSIRMRREMVTANGRKDSVRTPLFGRASSMTRRQNHPCPLLRPSEKLTTRPFIVVNSF